MREAVRAYGPKYGITTVPRGAGAVLRTIGASFLFALFTGISAHLRFYLPFTPVPVTGQVFAVLLSGLLLGSGFGSLSQALYVTLGLLGIPWFAIGAVGPSGGYLVGFIVAPAVIGLVVSGLNRRTGLTAVLPALAAGLCTIYLFGTVQFSLFTGTPVLQALRYSLLPFLPFDLLKAAAAAGVFRVLSNFTIQNHNPSFR